MLNYAAVTLFDARARQRQRHFALTNANTAEVAKSALTWMVCLWRLSWQRPVSDLLSGSRASFRRRTALASDLATRPTATRPRWPH
jgi:hypothetical protein